MKFAFRKLLILKSGLQACIELAKVRNGSPKKKKREQAPALQTQFSTGIVYHKDKKSQKKFEKKIQGNGEGDKSKTGLELADADDGH